MNKDALAELKQTPDGTFQFRLLSESFKKITIEKVHIILKDLIFAFEAGANGIMSDIPNATIRIETDDEVLEKTLSAQQSITFGQWTLKFLYGFSGEFRDLPVLVQSAAHFSMKKL